MKIMMVALAALAFLSVNCGGDKPPPQDPSSSTPSEGTPSEATPADADGGAEAPASSN